MIIKKFTAGTQQDAIMLAQNELGKDAIVMNIKTITPHGIHRLFKKPSVEVTAAVDDNLDKKNDVPREKANSRNYADDEDAEYEAKRKKEVLEAVTDSSPSAIEEKLNRLQSMLETRMADKKDSPIEKRIEEKTEEDDKNIESFKLIYNQLLQNEMAENYANAIIDEIENSMKKNAGMNTILVNIYQKIVLKLGNINSINADEPKRKFIFFVGPTGVGKTTTIAKLASMLSINKKKKIALVTSDTYRIAAVEQLTTYANILDIPLRVIYSPDELKELLAGLNTYDFVLIDTAGRSHRNAAQRNDLEKLISAVPKEERDIYLVLSATTKYRDLLKITEAYKEISEYSLIFTKLDETSCIGNLYNIHAYTGAPLSYATFGQNVPDDISVVDPQAIAKQILGGNE